MLPTHRKVVTSDLQARIELEIEQAQLKRQKRFEEALGALRTYVERAFKEDGPTFFELTQELWLLLMRVGLCAVELVCAMRRCAPTSSSASDAQEQRYHYHKEKTFPLRCVFGQGEMRGSQYVRGENAKKGRQFCPEFSRLGLLSFGGGFGPKLALECAHMSSICAFEAAKEQLERFFGYVPSTRSLHGLVDKFGPMAQEVLERAPCPSGDILVIQLDGRGLPKIRDEEYKKRCKSHQKGAHKKSRRRRNDSRYYDKKRSVGEHRAKTREVTVGIIYALNRGDDGGLNPTEEKHYFARLGDREAVMAHLGRMVSTLEKQPEQVIFLSDGAVQYVDLCKKYLPQAQHIIDYFHVLEYIWEAANAVKKQDKIAHEAWVRTLKRFLCQGNPQLVLAMLQAELLQIPARGPGNKSRREKMTKAMDYIAKRVDMMPYDRLLAEGIEIGSGAVESAVRQVVQIRFDGPGMRWGNARPDALLNLVCVRLSRQWSDLQGRVYKLAKAPQEVHRITPLGVQEALRCTAAA